MTQEIRIGKGGRRTLTVTVVEDDGSLAPLASLTAAAAGWTATGTVQDPNTSAKLVIDGAITAAVGRFAVTLTPTLVDGDIEPQKITVTVQ